VSCAANTSQQHIAKTIGAIKYMVQKAMEHHVHVDETRENLWGEISFETLL
jgi:hypothetical protein